MTFKEEASQLGQKAKRAALQIAVTSSAVRNNALLCMADRLEHERAFLLKENDKDIKGARRAGLSEALVDRLALNDGRIDAMAGGLRDVAALPDPVGEIVKMWRRPNGLQVGRMRIPLGVIAMIYEARPNVTADAAGLCLKSGNAVILRGGSEAYHSNQAVGKVLSGALEAAGVPQEAVQVVPSQDRGIVDELLQMEETIDLVIPRGGGRVDSRGGRQVARARD